MRTTKAAAAALIAGLLCAAHVHAFHRHYYQTQPVVVGGQPFVASGAASSQSLAQLLPLINAGLQLINGSSGQPINLQLGNQAGGGQQPSAPACQVDKTTIDGIDKDIGRLQKVLDGGQSTPTKKSDKPEQLPTSPKPGAAG